MIDDNMIILIDDAMHDTPIYFCFFNFPARLLPPLPYLPTYLALFFDDKIRSIFVLRLRSAMFTTFSNCIASVFALSE